MKYLCIRRDKFHNIEESVFAITISSKIKTSGNGQVFINSLNAKVAMIQKPVN